MKWNQSTKSKSTFSVFCTNMASACNYLGGKVRTGGYTGWTKLISRVIHNWCKIYTWSSPNCRSEFYNWGIIKLHITENITCFCIYKFSKCFSCSWSLIPDKAKNIKLKSLRNWMQKLPTDVMPLKKKTLNVQKIGLQYPHGTQVYIHK